MTFKQLIDTEFLDHCELIGIAPFKEGVFNFHPYLIDFDKNVLFIFPRLGFNKIIHLDQEIKVKKDIVLCKDTQTNKLELTFYKVLPCNPLKYKKRIK